jgi:hypothetical protein
MFTLTVTDHVRLDSEHVARNYTVHAQAAQRLAHAALSVRMTLVALLVVAAAASVAIWCSRPGPTGLLPWWPRRSRSSDSSSTSRSA